MAIRFVFRGLITLFMTFIFQNYMSSFNHDLHKSQEIIYGHLDELNSHTLDLDSMLDEFEYLLHEFHLATVELFDAMLISCYNLLLPINVM